jgi:hypothetical protein
VPEQSRNNSSAHSPRVKSEPPLYGHAAAIRALYQNARIVADEPNQRRPRGPKGGRMLRIFDALFPPILRPAYATVKI